MERKVGFKNDPESDKLSSLVLGPLCKLLGALCSSFFFLSKISWGDQKSSAVMCVAIPELCVWGLYSWKVDKWHRVIREEERCREKRKQVNA